MSSLIHPDSLESEDRWQNIVDVRMPDEYLQEHVPGSRNIPLNRLPEYAERLGQRPEVILSCRSGRRAEEARQLLETLGCPQAQVLDGGLLGWKAANKPTRSIKSGFSIMQQVQIIAGGMVVIGTLIKPLWFVALIAGLGLMAAGFTNTCMMAVLLAKMPWNRMDTEGQNNCQPSLKSPV